MDNFLEQLGSNINFFYSSFDRVILRGYIQGLFVEGSVVNLLRNLGFNNHSNGVLRTLTDQLNSHIKKQSEFHGIPVHWWDESKKNLYHSKINFVESTYRDIINQVNKKSVLLCIIKSSENVRTFANKNLINSKGENYLKMYSCNKFVSQYYIYILDSVLGLCCLKISSYLPFPCEFYMNGHNYLRQQFDNLGVSYKMQDNSFTQVSDLEVLDRLVKEYQPSILLNRADYWLNKFFRFDKGEKSTRSKLLTHKWFTYQTEISTNIVFKSPKFFNNYFAQILRKHHTIGLPDRLTEIFGLSKVLGESKTTQHRYFIQACIKHWLGKNSIKAYNKGGCLLRVETTINNPDLPGLKLKKPACNLQAYYWWGYACNSRYLNTLSDIDISTLTVELIEKYQQPIFTGKGKKIPALDLRKPYQLQLLMLLINPNNCAMGFKNKDLRAQIGDNSKTAKIAYELRKLRERGAIKKLQNTHYYRLTEEGYKWIYYTIFNYINFINPLLSKSYKKALRQKASNPSKIEEAYSQINKAVSQILSELNMVA